RPTFPRCAGEGKAIVVAVENPCCRFPVHGGSSPEGGEGGALDLALASQHQDQKLPPSGSSTHLPPLRRGRDSDWCGDLKFSCCRCPRSRGKLPRMGVKGALLIWLRRARIKIKSCPLPGLRPTFPRCAGEGTAIDVAT